MGERLGIFGGTFDPPHVGHLVVAVNARHELRLDRLLLVVAHDPWQKSSARAVSSAADRLAMVQAAVAGVDGLEASALEIERGGVSYSADTLRALADEDPTRKLFLIVGSDAAAGLPTWDRGEEVRALSTIVVVRRPGAENAAPPAGWSWQALETPRLEVSSTDLRARFADGRPLDYLVTPAVIDCIHARRLYRSVADD